MPLAGGVAAPIVAPLKSQKKGKPQNHIDTGTFIELQSETPNCAIYFTTDGTKPNPFKRFHAGKELTFRYTGPFTMKPGKRTLKSVALHKVTKVESHIVTKTFFVDDFIDPDASDIEDIDGSKSDSSSSSSSSSGKSSKRYTKSSKSSKLSNDPWADEAAVDNFLQRTADQGFSATNVSGTQINLWGGNPGMGWDIRTPGQTSFHGSYGGMPQLPQQPLADPFAQQQQLNTIANQLAQQMDNNRQATISEVRQAIKNLEANRPKALPAPTTTPASNNKFEPEVLPVSAGNGDLRKQLEHVYGHLLQHARADPEFKASIAPAKMGKVVAATFTENEDSFNIGIQLLKPGFKKPLEQPKSTPNGKSLRPKEIPKGHSVEEKVRQAKNEKAKAIELKTEEKPPEKVEHTYFETEEYVQEGTLRPVENFDANADCQKLRTAMKGLGTDEAAIIDVMARRSFKQRSEIVSRYKSIFGRDLISDFESELSFNFLKMCKALCLAPDDYDATELRASMKGLGTDEDALIEIVCTRTNAQIRAFKEAYSRLYPNRNLEADIDSETSSDFKRLLISLLQGNRDESKTFDRNLAIHDAKELFEAGESKFGTDESKFGQIILNRSNPHLRATFEEYEKLSKMTLEEAIKSEMSGDLKTAYVTFVRCIQNKPRYFALALEKSMKGLGTDDRTLLRIVITRCEIDMIQIKDAFKAEFSQRLGEWIKDDTSGDYMKTLLILTGESDMIA